MVRERLNDACPLFFWRVCLALILLAMSIGLVQVAGSATTLPLRGPDVHLNFLAIPPDLVRPSTLPPTSVTTSTSYNSNSLMSVFNLSTHTFQRRLQHTPFNAGFNALCTCHAIPYRRSRSKICMVEADVAQMPHLLLKCHTSISVAQMPHFYQCCSNATMVGSGGFEPPSVATKKRCLTTWPRPNHC